MSKDNKKISILQRIKSRISDSKRHKVKTKIMIAVAIDEAMKAKEWSKGTLAEKMNQRSQSIVTAWLGGKSNFTVDTLCDLERVLEIQLIQRVKDKPSKVVINIVAGTNPSFFEKRTHFSHLEGNWIKSNKKEVKYVN